MTMIIDSKFKNNCQKFASRVATIFLPVLTYFDSKSPLKTIVEYSRAHTHKKIIHNSGLQHSIILH